MVNNKAHIRFVYTHPKGIGAHHYAGFIVFPIVLFLGAQFNIKAGVVMVGRYVVLT